MLLRINKKYLLVAKYIETCEKIPSIRKLDAVFWQRVLYSVQKGMFGVCNTQLVATSLNTQLYKKRATIMIDLLLGKCKLAMFLKTRYLGFRKICDPMLYGKTEENSNSEDATILIQVKIAATESRFE